MVSVEVHEDHVPEIVDLASDLDGEVPAPQVANDPDVETRDDLVLLFPSFNNAYLMFRGYSRINYHFLHNVGKLFISHLFKFLPS